MYYIFSLIFILFVFLLFYYFQKITKVNFFSKISTYLISKENSKDLFYIKNLNTDEVIVNICRIVLGLVLLYRTIYVGVFFLPIENNFFVIIIFYVLLILIFFFLIGFFTPITSILLLFLHLKASVLTSSFTLAVEVSNFLIIGMILYPAGRIISIDSLLIKNKNFFITKVYSFVVSENRKFQIYLSKFFPFFIYSLLCIYSVTIHLNDELWTSFQLAEKLLTSMYLSNSPFFFRELIPTIPFFREILSLSVILMMFWYFALLPFYYLGGVFRIFAITWGLCFFCFSLFILQLNTLPYIEFILWVFLFWPIAENNKFFKKKVVNLLYDDKCNLCDKTVNLLFYLDLFQNIRFLPISLNSNKAKELNINKSDLLKDIYCWEVASKDIFKGFNLYFYLSKILPVLWVFHPLFILLKYSKTGYYLYEFIAKRRIKYFGICRIPTSVSKLNLKYNSIKLIKNTNEFFLSSFVATITFFIIVYLTSFSFMGNIKDKIEKIPYFGPRYYHLINTAQIFGMERLNVFNTDDIKMENNYFTVSGVDKKGNEFLLPYESKNGQKLKWQKSDRVYFGNSLQYRRSKILDTILVPISKKDKILVCEVMNWGRIFYDYELFNIQFFKTQDSSLEFSLKSNEYPVSQLVYENQVDFNFCNL